MTTGRLLAGLQPQLCVAEAWGAPRPSPLWPAEAAAIAGAAPGRVAEFARGRDCARAALAALGLAPGAIGRASSRAPVWPAGVVGSITHCPGYTAAAVARAPVVTSVGIDAEPNQPLPEGVLATVATTAERAALAGLPPGVAWDRLLFAAKESVYKAWWPLTGRWLGFEDATVTISAAGTFAARVTVAGPLGVVAGRFACDGDHLVCAVVVA
ncbi:MAG: 4'-phosphopantetheinyl transferase superfamily protein [Kofleriaceae bacterium]